MAIVICYGEISFKLFNFWHFFAYVYVGTNIFWIHMETKILHSYVCLHKLYARFVDDCFAVFNNDSSSLNFLSLFNFKNNNIKFTMKSASQCISLLDVCIKVNSDNIDMWV